jgi:Pyruvate/2-oxoacid:ferredoxin oxidoreductase gamma subunit
MDFLFVGHTEQGVSTSARLVARALLASGMKVQMYAPEADRNTDVHSVSVRAVPAKEQILEKGIAASPDFVVAFDEGKAKEYVKNMKDGSVLIVNSKEKFANPVLAKKKIRAISVDATGIALSTTMRPFPAAAMTGALSKAFSKITVKALRSAVESDFYDHIAENQTAVEQGLKSAK